MPDGPHKQCIDGVIALWQGEAPDWGDSPAKFTDATAPDSGAYFMSAADDAELSDERDGLEKILLFVDAHLDEDNPFDGLADDDDVTDEITRPEEKHVRFALAYVLAHKPDDEQDELKDHAEALIKSLAAEPVKQDEPEKPPVNPDQSVLDALQGVNTGVQQESVDSDHDGPDSGDPDEEHTHRTAKKPAISAASNKLRADPSYRTVWRVVTGNIRNGVTQTGLTKISLLTDVISNRKGIGKPDCPIAPLTESVRAQLVSDLRFLGRAMYRDRIMAEVNDLHRDLEAKEAAETTSE
ncbi:MAG: hypothetical protein ABIG32_00685 [Candidatus Uhrbacteria bacterium]